MNEQPMPDPNTDQILQVRTNYQQFARFRRLAASFPSFHMALKDMLDVYDRFGNATRMPRNFMLSSPGD